MVNDADAAADLVRYGKYRPLGERGFYTRMRGQRFGLDTDCFARANASTVLMAQVETLESVRNLDAILAVEGLGGIFVGPGDLSAALGRPGDFANPELAGIIKDCLRRARATGRHAGVLPTTPTLIEASLEAGSDLCVFTSDINPVIQAWRTDLDGFRRRLSR
jgi:2-dehydro-3-deoxyglucarate aldolase/4-hydroxy-2-oxoheptanedioate aldolase